MEEEEKAVIKIKWRVKGYPLIAVDEKEVIYRLPYTASNGKKMSIEPMNIHYEKKDPEEKRPFLYVSMDGENTKLYLKRLRTLCYLSREEYKHGELPVSEQPQFKFADKG